MSSVQSTDHKFNVPSVPMSSVHSADHTVHVPSVLMSSVQSADYHENKKVHVSSENSDCKESGWVGSHCKDEDVFGISSEKKLNISLNAESVESTQKNFQTSAQSCMQDAFLPQICQRGIYLPSGFYMNVGSAYCGGCQMYGTLLQRLY